MFLRLNCKLVRAGISLLSGVVNLRRETLTGVQRALSVQRLIGSNTTFGQENPFSVQLHV